MEQNIREPSSTGVTLSNYQENKGESKQKRSHFKLLLPCRDFYDNTRLRPCLLVRKVATKLEDHFL